MSPPLSNRSRANGIRDYSQIARKVSTDSCVLASDNSQIREESKPAITPFRLCIKKGRLILQQHRRSLSINENISDNKPKFGLKGEYVKSTNS